MNGSAALARQLGHAARAQLPFTGVKLVICPPFPLLLPAAQAFDGLPVSMGAQNCAAVASGAWTGEVSAPMLHESGCEYVILGHSERRLLLNESGEMIRQKTLCALQSGLIPIVCVGETQAQREAGEAFNAVSLQLQDCLPVESKGEILLAYEPVWAIGSGLSASAAQIQQMHAHISEVAASVLAREPQDIRVIYGGSVRAETMLELWHLRGVDGLLVGGASIQPEAFGQLLRIARNDNLLN